MSFWLVQRIAPLGGALVCDYVDDEVEEALDESLVRLGSDNELTVANGSIMYRGIIRAAYFLSRKREVSKIKEVQRWVDQGCYSKVYSDLPEHFLGRDILGRPLYRSYNTVAWWDPEGDIVWSFTEKWLWKFVKQAQLKAIPFSCA
ncbi:hypothetical protein FBF30_01785 [Candidatus Saccharibacteria bacterium oral taxon 955]|nr:hypothetical protein FBF30_01785 [Candidatus Saccharibacteria bacterium oral taxon 955]